MAAEKKSRRSGSSKSGQEFLCENLNFAGKEAYKRLRTNLQFCFADSDIKISFVQVYVFSSKIQQLRNSYTRVNQHKDDLIVLVVRYLPQAVDFLFGELFTIPFVRIAVFELRNIHKIRIIFAAKLIFHCIFVELIHQNF